MRFILLILPLFVVATCYASSISEVDKLHKTTYSLMESFPDSALAVNDYALEMSKDIRYEWGEANSYYIKGYIYQNQGEMSAALLMFLKSSQILKYQSDGRSIKNYVRVLTYCGYILRQHSKYEESIGYFNNAIEIAEDNELVSDQLMLLYNKSFVFKEMEDYISMLKSLKEVETLANGIRDDSYLISSWIGMGIANVELLNYERAKSFYFKVIENSQIASNSSVSGAWKNLGVVYQLQNNFDSAEFCYLNGLKIIEELESGSDRDRRMFEALLAISELYLEYGIYNKGLSFGEKATQFYDKVERIPDHFKVFKLLSDLNYEQKRINDSYQQMSRYYEENIAYQSHQEEVQKLRDKFKIDILLAGFYSEVEKETTTSMYQMIIGLLIMGIIFWISISRIKFGFLRIYLEKEIKKINKDSLV